MKVFKPVVDYIIENPNASIEEVSEKFSISKQSIYDLRHHYGLSKKRPKPEGSKTNSEDRKNKLIQQMLEEIATQKAIIKYLEGKLAQNGSTV